MRTVHYKLRLQACVVASHELANAPARKSGGEAPCGRSIRDILPLKRIGIGSIVGVRAPHQFTRAGSLTPDLASGIMRKAERIPQLRDPCGTEFANKALKHGHALGQPSQLLCANGIFARIAGLDIGFAQKVIGALLELAAGRPDGPQSGLQLLGQCPQPVQIVGLGGIEGPHQKDAVIEPLGGLVEVKNSHLRRAIGYGVSVLPTGEAVFVLSLTQIFSQIDKKSEANYAA